MLRRGVVAGGVGIGIVGNLLGYPILGRIAAAIVGFMVARMGWSLGWDVLCEELDRGIDEEDGAARSSAPCWSLEAFKAYTIFVSEKWGDYPAHNPLVLSVIMRL